MSQTMKCPKCGGTGQICLPGHLVQMLDIIKQHSPISTTDLYAQVKQRVPSLNVTINAINNRLTALHEMGLIHRDSPNGVVSRYSPYLWSTKEQKHEQ